MNLARDKLEKILKERYNEKLFASLLISSDTVEYEGANSTFALIGNKHYNQGKLLRGMGVSSAAVLMKNEGYNHILETTKRLNIAITPTQAQAIQSRNNQIETRKKQREANRQKQKQAILKRRAEKAANKKDKSYSSAAYEVA